jgi:hypothetical protein
MRRSNMREKPIRVFWSPLSGKFYASQKYKDNGDGTVTITGKKYDVTQDIARIIIEEEVTFHEKSEEE